MELGSHALLELANEAQQRHLVEATAHIITQEHAGRDLSSASSVAEGLEEGVQPSVQVSNSDLQV